MDELQLAVSLALRDTETCTAAADVWDESQISTVGEPKDQRRVLAVVTHRHAVEGTAEGEEGPRDEKEQGCLFVMKYRSPSSSELYPYLLFPIIPELTGSLEQIANRTSSFNASEFKLTLKISKQTITLASGQMHTLPESDQINTLSAVLEESRRLKKLVHPDSDLLSPTSPATDSKISHISSATESVEATPAAVDQPDDLHETNWEWLYFYSSYKDDRILPSQQPKPDDIRSVLHGPKLSASSAGLWVDEDEDLALIRDQWIRSQVTTLKSQYSQADAVKLRICTFNVNGKPPSQSLSSWIRGSSDDSSTPDDALTSLERNTSDLSEHTPPTEISPEHEKTQSEQIHTDIPTTDTSSVTESTVQPSVSLSTSEDHPEPSTPATSVLLGPSEDLPDIFVIGFQELDLSAEALLYRTSTVKSDAWIAAIFDALGKDADGYVQLTSKQLVGVLVVVIIRKEMRPIVKEVTTSAGGVGIMGIMGNKGATAVRLRLKSTTLTFVCSHLAAFDDYAEKRNSDFAEICRKLQFHIAWKGARNIQPLTADIWETDMLFWLGDLNYRIDLPDEEVRSLLASKPHGYENDTLLAYDQLKTAARHKQAFAGFFEHNITFLPTYRFSDEPLDALGYDLKRRPAWTDRILYLAADPKNVTQKSYQSHPDITLSDHKPISADYNLLLEAHDPHELHRVAMRLFKKLGNFENSGVPQVTLLDGTEIDLGEVSYYRPASHVIRVKNEGNVACAFRFIPLDPGTAISKEWLTIEPISGILLPQETELIKLTINIDKRTASFLNHGNTKLEDHLVLHLVKGTDHLISVSGSYQPTCFANSLAWLVRSPGPIRGEGTAQLLPEANTLSAPRELMFLVEWLITSAKGVDDLFLTRGDESLVDLIRVHLDTQPLSSGKEIVFPEGTDNRAIALAFADAMLQFLDSLTEPVIPWVLHPQCALAEEREDAFEILDHVPGFARNVYVTVTAFLHFIGQSGGPDRPAKLAKVFADVLLRDNPRAPLGIPQLTPLGKRKFLLLTIS